MNGHLGSRQVVAYLENPDSDDSSLLSDSNSFEEEVISDEENSHFPIPEGVLVC